MEDNLEKVERRIQETESDLKGAQEREDRRLELTFAEILRLLLEERKHLTTATGMVLI